MGFSVPKAWPQRVSTEDGRFERLDDKSGTILGSTAGGHSGYPTGILLGQMAAKGSAP